VLVQQGQFSSAIAQFQKVIDADDTRAGSWADLADAQLRSGNADDAVKNFKKALDMTNAKDPSKPRDTSWSLGALQYKLARAYDKKGLATDATAAYEAATHADPSNASCWYYLGYAYKNRGKNRDAVAAFEKYLKLAQSVKKPKSGTELLDPEESEIRKDTDQINDEIAFLKEAR
jgi:tetratricopeptide (TPR) repeat protein